MRLLNDYVHPSGEHRRDIGQCRIRLYGERAEHVVVCSELRDDPGGAAHIASAAEYIAAEIAFAFGIDEFGYIEHLPATRDEPESFYLVQFADYEPRELPEGSELHLRIGAASRVPLDRDEAEAIVGQRIE